MDVIRQQLVIMRSKLEEIRAQLDELILKANPSGKISSSDYKKRVMKVLLFLSDSPRWLNLRSLFGVLLLDEMYGSGEYKLLCFFTAPDDYVVALRRDEAAQWNLSGFNGRHDHCGGGWIEMSVIKKE